MNYGQREALHVRGLCDLSMRQDAGVNLLFNSNLASVGGDGQVTCEYTFTKKQKLER